MKPSTSSQAAQYFASWKSVYKTAFTVCLAITGSESAAAEALMQAMLKGGVRLSAGAKLALAKETALSNAGGEYDALMDADIGTVAEAGEMPRRAAFLKLGCGLSISEISDVLCEKNSLVRGEIDEIILRTGLSSRDEAIKRLKQLSKSELESGVRAPDEATFVRALQKRIVQTEEESEMHAASGKLLRTVVSFILLLVMGFMLWVGAVMFIYIKDKVQLMTNAQSVTEVTDAGIQGEN